MQGYSVTEAASVLGVPTERVWELLARGVLSGAPEGETGMRVYLQPRPAPAPPEEARPNGHGSEPERELSPFRELLTEFRNLTERYGQALLALGEARGEVASLRSRVDLLEARMDLRLPMSEPQASTRWASTPLPMTAERAVVETAPADVPPAPTAPEHADDEHRARARGPRRATESFAEALARAEDPSVPELPSATDAAPVAVDTRDEHEDVPENVLPRELPVAETMPVADEPRPPATEVMTAVADPDAELADAEPDVGAMPDRPTEREQAIVAMEPMAEPEPESAVPPLEVSPDPVDPANEPPVDVADAAPGTESQEPELVIDVRQPEAAPDTTIAASAAVGDAAVNEQEALAAPLEWDAERYTTEIEAPDWLEAEAFDPEPIAAAPADREATHEPEVAAEASEEPEPAEELEPVPADAPGEADVPDDVAPSADLEPDAATEPEPAPRSGDGGIAAAGSTGSPSPMDEETILWFGRSPQPGAGADEMEVSAAQTRPPAPAAAGGSSDFPGSQELDEALAALDAISTPADSTDAAASDDPDEWPPASAGTVRTSASPAPRPTAPPIPVRTPGPQIGAAGSPATRAYRRLRRIFPE